MHEAVASHAHFVPQACTTQDADRRRQLEEFEELVEKLIESSNQRERELKEVKADRDRLLEENKRLKGE